MATPEQSDSRGRAYAERLARLEDARWKRWLDVQAPYRWNLRRLALGKTLEVGCGIGRNLRHLGEDAVGVDSSPAAIELARARGCTAYTTDAFRSSPDARHRGYDSLLLAHVVEHMPRAEARRLLADYVEFVRPGGQIVLIAPQEAGFRSDPTHVEFADAAVLAQLLGSQGVPITRSYSFPFPRWVGHLFPHNEFVVTGRLPAS